MAKKIVIESHEDADWLKNSAGRSKYRAAMLKVIEQEAEKERLAKAKELIEKKKPEE